jgi:hypothetical protein
MPRFHVFKPYPIGEYLEGMSERALAPSLELGEFVVLMVALDARSKQTAHSYPLQITERPEKMTDSDHWSLQVRMVDDDLFIMPEFGPRWLVLFGTGELDLRDDILTEDPEICGGYLVRYDDGLNGDMNVLYEHTQLTNSTTTPRLG